MPRTTRLRQLFLAPGFRDFAPRSPGSAVSMTVCGEAGWREKGGEGRGEGGKEKGTGMQLRSFSSWASSFFYL